MSVLDFLRDFAFLIALLVVIGFLLVWAELRSGDSNERRNSSTEIQGGPPVDRATSALERTPPPSPRAPPPARPPASPPSVSGPVRRPGNDPRRGE